MIITPLKAFIDIDYQIHRVYKYFLDKQLKDGSCIMTHAEVKEIYTLP